MSVTLLQDVGNGFKEKKHDISREIVQVFSGEHERSFNRLAEETLTGEFEKLIGIISERMMTQDTSDFGDDVFRWGKSFGRVVIRSGVNVEEGLLIVPFFRKVLIRHIRTIFLENDHAMEDYFIMADFLHPMIDQTVYAFTEAYVEHHNASFQHAKDELMELSVPLVPLTEDVAILPIIGTIDTHRSQELLIKALNKGREMELSFIIIDLSGVHMIDTAVAHNLFQLHDALKVIGITAVFSGVRPELAQTMVSLGISFDQMKVCGTLPRALRLTGVSLT
ncbi:STAS domain-containing protein [Salisediminibacterium selenitireducens]|uniref:Anti-sigma-factor antagonist n=1 Tax=Bacillus selenitireducens (strain ATCC 700615 / DSM 15326 / MLS10) TaxID=439292 RepID=D6XX43_BACIE|nr:STAS domain-containing protein [Salisediminibacterium selenitireducens]ADI00020.1 anti-sigma-factor antagonist [[Bacillus] selenitireducens MLS10]